MQARVILLDSENDSNVLKGWSDQLFLTPPMEVKSTDTFQNIYLTDPNAEIKEGDWYIHEGTIRQFLDPEGVIIHEDIDKIICSTDKSLVSNKGIQFIEPQLSEQSIKLLIDYYNKNGKMPDEVEVEEQEIFVVGIRSAVSTGFEIKLNPQGLVDITIPEEKMYNRSEVVSLVHDAVRSIGDEIRIYEYPDGSIMDVEGVDEWLDKNL